LAADMNTCRDVDECATDSINQVCTGRVSIYCGFMYREQTKYINKFLTRKFTYNKKVRFGKLIFLAVTKYLKTEQIYF